MIYLGSVKGNALEPYVQKHAVSSLNIPVWQTPDPVIPDTKGPSSVASNGVSNANGFIEVYFTGSHQAGVQFSAASISGPLTIIFPDAGIFIAKIEDQGSAGILKH